MPSSTAADLEAIRDVTVSYMNKVISDITGYRAGAEGNAALSPALKNEVTSLCAQRVEANLANINKNIERFKSGALGVFDQSSS